MVAIRISCYNLLGSDTWNVQPIVGCRYKPKPIPVQTHKTKQLHPQAEVLFQNSPLTFSSQGKFRNLAVVINQLKINIFYQLKSWKRFHLSSLLNGLIRSGWIPVCRWPNLIRQIDSAGPFKIASFTVGTEARIAVHVAISWEKRIEKLKIKGPNELLRASALRQIREKC